MANVRLPEALSDPAAWWCICHLHRVGLPPFDDLYPRFLADMEPIRMADLRVVA